MRRYDSAKRGCASWLTVPLARHTYPSRRWRRVNHADDQTVRIDLVDHSKLPATSRPEPGQLVGQRLAHAVRLLSQYVGEEVQAGRSDRLRQRQLQQVADSGGRAHGEYLPHAGAAEAGVEQFLDLDHPVGSARLIPAVTCSVSPRME